MGTIARMMNVGRGERIFRAVMGVILIILAFFISGVPGVILGLIGIGSILTAIFRY